jgi:DNA-binding transcriptional MerR regulator
VTDHDARSGFNVKAVVRETGLSADVLRVWERRYGVPRPSRSAGGQRRYSRSDVELLKWLVARQAEGMSISRAVDLWREQEAQGKRLDLTEPQRTQLTPRLGSLEELRDDWIAACIAFDRLAAESVVGRAFAAYPVASVCGEIFLTGLVEIGKRWHQCEITVHQEHFASELAIYQVERLVGAAPPPWRAERIAVGCVADEHHTLCPLLLTLLLRERGWDTAFLGANLPAEGFGPTSRQLQPSLVVLAAERLVTAAHLIVAGDALRDLGLPLLYGGRIFDAIPALRPRIAGRYLGSDLDAAATEIEHALGRPLVEIVDPAPRPCLEASDALRQARLPIEARVARVLAIPGDVAMDTIQANLNLTANLLAALQLGAFDALQAEVSWSAELLQYRGVGAERQREYVAAYRDAVASQLGVSGAVILDWLDQLVTDTTDD